MTRRSLAPAIIGTAALTVAACGSDDDDTSADAAGSPDTGTVAGSADEASTAVVDVVEIDGMGAVLTDTDGQVLYTTDEEADPDVLCTDDCEAMWPPLEAGPESPAGPAGVTGLDVVERPDGTRQVTHDGRRLYTFSVESPGEVTGDGLSDSFGDQRFTWHAVVVDATTAAGDPTGNTGDGSATTTPSQPDDDGYSYSYP